MGDHGVTAARVGPTAQLFAAHLGGVEAGQFCPTFLGQILPSSHCLKGVHGCSAPLQSIQQLCLSLAELATKSLGARKGPASQRHVPPALPPLLQARALYQILHRGVRDHQHISPSPASGRSIQAGLVMCNAT